MTADALPTWQVNGVVWSQVTVGNIVYATGQFSAARPPGAAPGTRQVARGNLLAYNIVTGGLVTSFDHRLNGQGLTITATPDHLMVLVGGDFTTIDGKPRRHIAAFSVQTGRLINGFAPSINGAVSAIAATNATFYIGGSFSTASRTFRTRLAAYTRAGQLTTFKASANAAVTALLLTPRGDRLLVGGHFTVISGRLSYGIGALSSKTGALLG